LVTWEQDVARRPHEEAFQVVSRPEALLVHNYVDGERCLGNKVAKDRQRIVGRTVVTHEELGWQQCLFGETMEKFLQIATTVVGA
jgi:hypothetical protein